MTWRTCSLGDVLVLQRGFDLPKRERRKGTVPIVSSSGITGFHDESRAHAPGVVTGRYGTLGEVFFIRQDYWPLNTALFVKDFKGNDPRFISYLLRTLAFGRQNAAGAVPGVNRNHLHRLQVRIPERPRQERIAEILSAYDDLIENNARRIKILEEMARSLYREWFVDFRFPGHERAQIARDLPEGWRRTTLGEVARIVMGQAPPSDTYNDQAEGLPFHQGVTHFDTYHPVHRAWCTAPNVRLAEQGDILFSVRAPVGRTNIAADRLVIGRGLSAIRHRADSQAFALLQLNARVSEDSMGNGAIFKAVTKDDVHGISWTEPCAALRERFETVAGAMWAQVGTLSRASDVLRRSRDLLLPRLISGEIELST